MAEINIKGFSGSNNIKDSEQFFVEKGIAEPRVILNADVDITGKLISRKGQVLFWDLPHAHSLWAGNNSMFCVADGTLYRNVSGIATNVGTVLGPKHPLFYVDAEDKVYVSNKYWQGVFNPATNDISPWGTPLPPGPMLLSGDGSLSAGKYHVCMTNVSDGELSGNGPITNITLKTEGGIQVLNRPAGALVWVTDADEGIFYLVGATSKIVDLPTVEPLPSFMCSPPPYLENLCYAFGRIWGSSENTIYYSEAFHLGWFKPASNKFEYEEKITLIAKVPTGLYIGTEQRTRFLAGTIPEQMVQSDAGAGSIKGSLVYCNNMPELSWTLGTPEKDFTDVPVWLTAEGIVVGSTSGKFFNVSKNKIKMAIPSQGASLYRNLDGMIQYLTNFKQGRAGSGAGFEDAETLNVFRDGKIDTRNKSIEKMGSRAGFADIAVVEVYRGGVLI